MVLPFRPAAVIFDFDETMIDLEKQHEAADAALCSLHGDDYSRLSVSLRESSGRRILDVVREMQRFFRWRETLPELMEIRQRLFDDICRNAELRLMPAVRETVEAIRAAGLPMAITTSAVRSSIEIILDRFALRGAFTLIVDGSEVTAAKPDPEAYLITARRLKAGPERCVVFEDSTVGVLAAKAAGMYCIAVRNPTARLTQNLSAADLVVDSFAGVREMF